MGEHDDDLESEVHDGAQEETDGFPDTGDELDDEVTDTPEQEDTDADAVIDDDESEL